MDNPAAVDEIPKLGMDPVPITDSRHLDAKRLRHFPTPADPVSKVLDDDNLLIEILVCLGFPTTLVRAALACKRWLYHVSKPAFLRRFRELHPPRLLGFYLSVRPLSYKPTRPFFVPMQPQPTELTAVARCMASYSLNTYRNVWIEDCQNGSILIRGSSDGKSTFWAGDSSPSRVIHYGEILHPLGPKGAVAIVHCPPHDPPMDNTLSRAGYTLFKQGVKDLSYLSLFEERKNSVAQVYMLKDGVWCMHTSNMAQHLCRTMGVRPLLVDSKIYIADGMSDILVLDLKASAFLKFQLPEGVKHGKWNTMFSHSDDDSKVYLIHVKELQLHIWLHNGNNWLLEDAICLREMYANLRISDCEVWIDYTDVAKIIQVGEKAEFACLQIGRDVLYLDIKCRVMHRVYQMVGNNQQYLVGIYPLMMIWPPTFPTPKDDTAREESLLEMGGS